LKTAARASPAVLFLADHLGHSGGVSHGVTSYFLQVLPALRAAGVNLTVCFLREPHPAAQALRGQGIEPIFLAAGKWNPFVIGSIARVARGCGAQLLHVTGLKASLAARAAARLVHAPVIVHTHDFNTPVFTRPLQKLLARPTDVGICVSESTREPAMRAYCTRAERTFVIHNGIRLSDIAAVEADARAQVRAELGLDGRHTVIGMVGRMYPVKGHREMLEMLEAVVTRLPLVRLLLVGDGPERPACEGLAAELGLTEHVRFLGQRGDVPRLLSAVDILAMPSRTEGLGLAAIEALAAGKPVVAYAVGGLCEVVRDRVDGRLVDAGDRHAFVRALIELIESEQQRVSYGANARRHSMRFSLENHVQRLMECYSVALAEAGDARESSLGRIRP
jgi:glycosyltransferase involved in cell wall biosynthesis